MPPKNKGKRQKPADAKAPAELSDPAKEEEDKKQLREETVRLQEELDREREKKKQLQLEADKIRSFIKIALRGEERVKAQVKMISKDMEEDKRRHKDEIKCARLAWNHQNISESKVAGLVSTEAAHKEQEQIQIEPLAELDFDNLSKELELKHEEEMRKFRNHFGNLLTECEAEYERKYESLVQQLEHKRLNAVEEAEAFYGEIEHQMLEERKSAHQLVQDLCQELDCQSLNLNQNLEEDKKEVSRLRKDNKRLTECISKVEEELTQKERKLKNSSVPIQKYPVEKEKRELEALKSKHEALIEKFCKLQLEKDELHKTFPQRLKKVEEAGNARIAQLERKVKATRDRAEKTEAQLRSVLSAPDVDQTVLAEVANEVEKELDAKNNTIKELRRKKALIAKAHKDLLWFYKAKLRALGVPAEKLCLKPADNSLAGKSLE